MLPASTPWSFAHLLMVFHCRFDQAGWRPYCSDNGVFIQIIQTDPANPLRNLRIISPGFLYRCVRVGGRVI